jgi:hypothetical protein
LSPVSTAYAIAGAWSSAQIGYLLALLALLALLKALLYQRASVRPRGRPVAVLALLGCLFGGVGAVFVASQPVSASVEAEPAVGTVARAPDEIRADRRHLARRLERAFQRSRSRRDLCTRPYAAAQGVGCHQSSPTALAQRGLSDLRECVPGRSLTEEPAHAGVTPAPRDRDEARANMVLVALRDNQQHANEPTHRAGGTARREPPPRHPTSQRRLFDSSVWQLTASPRRGAG